jgi:hypothetical protein
MRGIDSAFRHVSKGHLHRYCSEFEFRHNRRAALRHTDSQRAADIVLNAEGRRLAYNQPA